MIKRSIITVLLLLGCVSLGAGNGIPADYNHLLERNLWYTSSNAAGIRQDSGSASIAEIFGNYTFGDFHAEGDAPKLCSVGAAAYGIKHCKNFSMKGSFSFMQKDGKDMYGSMLLNPDKYPVDVLEFTPGHKTLQSYGFDGAASVDLGDRWRIGAGMDFNSSNYSKRKDLRYVDYVLDMRVAPSVLFHSGDFAIGADIIISKCSENVDAEQVGTAVASYEAFLDKGLWYGVSQLWTGSGVHLLDNGVHGFPISESGRGAGLQVSYGPFFFNTEMLFTDGCAGEKRTVWFRFPGCSAKADAGWKTVTSKGQHIVKLSASRRSTMNNETVLEKVSVGGISNTVEHGSNRIYEKRSGRAGLSYSFTGATAEFRAALDASTRQELASLIYPGLVWRKTLGLDVSVGGTLLFGKFKLDAGLGVGTGWYNERARNAFEGSGITEETFRLEEWNEFDLDYELATRVCPALALEYEFIKGMSVALEGASAFAGDRMRISSGLRLVYKF